MLKPQIVGGLLKAGALLPSTRALASDQSISRTTVMAAYEQLAAEGYIETAQGARSRVSSGVTASTKTRGVRVAPKRRTSPKLHLSAYGRRVCAIDSIPPQVALKARTAINFLYGALSSADFPTLAWRKAYDQVLRQRQPGIYYSAVEGEYELRSELQGYLRRARGLVCDAEQILIVNGSQQAIDLCARMLIEPGDPVVMEEPGYILARQSFLAVGSQIIETPVDEQGLLTQHLPAQSTTLAYVTPSHQFPLGGVMPIARRRELLAWAQHNDAWIVEDDYDGEFRYGLHPVDALQSIDEAGTVIYVGTFSKALSPQMRLGYMVLPVQLIAAFRQAERLADRHTPRSEQLVLAALISSGAYERHGRRNRRKNEQRRTALLRAIKLHLPSDTQVEGAASGLHLVVWLGSLQAHHEAALVECARNHGVGVWSITPMYAAGQIFRQHPCAGLVLGYAGLELREIEEGIKRLAATLARLAQEIPSMGFKAVLN